MLFLFVVKITQMENIILSVVPLEAIKIQIAESVRIEMSKLLQPSLVNQSDELLTRKEAAKILGVSLPTILEWTKQGKVKGYRIGSRVRYKKFEIESSLTLIKTKSDAKED